MTQIEKEALFAQYWGQKVATEKHFEEVQLIEVNSPLALGTVENYYLQLKSIESITDEDAKLLGWETAKGLLEWFALHPMTREEADMLRKLSYLLPFRQYSTEQLIEQGIAKI